MRKSWGVIVLFLAVIALPCLMLLKNIGAITVVTLLVSFFLLALVPGFLLISLVVPKSNIIERLVIGSISGMALFALGGFISGWTGVFLVRLLPSLIVYVLAVYFSVKEKGLTRFTLLPPEPRDRNVLGIILLASSVGALTLFSGVLNTLGSQKLNWTESWSYYTDLPWQIAMAAEVGQRTPEFFPYVSETKLAYPFGYHSFVGVWETYSSASAAQIVLQVWPIIYFVLLPLVVSVVTYKISKSIAATLLATALLGTLGGLSLATSSIFTWFPQYSISPTLEFSNLLLLALLWFIVQFSVFSAEPINVAGWATIFFFSFFAATSKGSSWAILILFLGIALVLSVFSKKHVKNVAIAFVVSFMGVLIGLISIVKSSGALTINLMKLSEWDYNDQVIGYSTLLIMLWGAATSALVFLTNATHKILLASSSLSLCGAVSVNLFMEHPGGSEVYFYLSSLPLFIIVSTIALIEIASSIGLIIIFPFVLNNLLWQVTQLYPQSQIFPLTFFYPLFFGFIGTISIFQWTKIPDSGKAFRVLLIISLSIMSTIGFQTIAVKAPVFSGQNHVDAVPFTKAQMDLLLELKLKSEKNDIVATNIHCISAEKELEETSENCDARSFAVSAFAERRTLIEGWAYTPNGPTYWDPAMLKSNDAFFNNPTKEGAMKLADNGVSWLFVDEQLLGAKDFSAFADLINRNEFGSIWRLK